MRITILAVTLLALASDLEAQGTRENSLITGRGITQDSLSKALRECDREVLRPSCDQIGAMARRLFPDAVGPRGLAHVRFADYVTSLEPRPCPKGASVRQTEWIPPRLTSDRKGVLVESTIDMLCSSSEVILWDRARDRPVVSLFDGNMIRSYKAPMPQVASALPETTQAGAPSARSVVDQRPKVDTPPRRMTASEIRTPVVKPPLVMPPRAIARVDTVFLNSTVVRVDTVWITTKETTEIHTQARSGFPFWRVLGVAAALGALSWAGCEYVFGCGGTDITVTNTNINGSSGMRAAMRRGFSLTLP